jgi:hypothetical protein
MGKILRLEEIKLNEPLIDALYDSNGMLLMQRGGIMTTEKLKALALKGLRYLELGAPTSPGKREGVAVLDAPVDSSVAEPLNVAAETARVVVAPLPLFALWTTVQRNASQN